jgi:DNA-binding response OmpR family regulator
MTRILIIDDEEPVRALLRQMLEAAGYEVQEAPDGEVGMKLFRATPADLIITDIFMPNKEGIQTIREVRMNFPQVKVMAISGGGSRINLDVLPTAKALGAHGILAKPFKEQELLEAVRAVLAQ